MTPLRNPPRVALDRKPVLIISGSIDPIVPSARAARLAALLLRAGANVRHEIVAASHGLVQDDLLLAAAFFEGLRNQAAPGGNSPA
jgi:phospholipase/carboxylesterase